MKPLLAVLSLCALLALAPDEEKVIRLPLTRVDGYGPFKPGFAMISPKNMEPNDEWFKTQYEVKGIPSNWTEVVKRDIWFDAWQFAYQQHKQGNLTVEVYKELEVAWNINDKTHSFSDTPIKCFVYMIFGKDEKGVLKYKLDFNHNLDFSDEPEFTAVQMKWSKVDSLQLHLSHQVKYETVRNNHVVELTAPVLIVAIKSRLFRNIPQHAEAQWEGYTLAVSPASFTSAMYETSQLCAVSPDHSASPVINENEYLRLGTKTYHYLGVNMDRMELILRRVPDDTVIYSSQVGFHAKPIAGKDISTQKDISLDQFKGKYVYVDFWGTWCGPCVAELPTLKKVYAQIDPKKVEFLGVAKDDQESLTKMIRKESIPWHQILCEKDLTLIREYNIQAYPTSFLINPEGKIVAKNIPTEKLLDSLNYYVRH
jgi:thiol-disulfide isomerase/thioredoxin